MEMISQNELDLLETVIKNTDLLLKVDASPELTINREHLDLLNRAIEFYANGVCQMAIQIIEGKNAMIEGGKCIDEATKRVQELHNERNQLSEALKKYAS